MRIQIAIQGGGAKIVGLIAAMQAVQKLQAAGKLEVTRLAGTSAGAVVAALFSAGVPMGELRVSLAEGLIKRLFERYGKPGAIEIAKQLIQGEPICNPEPIRAFLREIFSNLGKERLEHLPVPVKINSADIANSAKYTHEQDESVVDALMCSTGIPFVFRVWDSKMTQQQNDAARDRKDPMLVDGGICENLPINELLKDEREFGPVVAITFSTQKFERPAGILGFAKSVMDTAIDNSVHRARSLLPASAIFEIGKWFPISTLDFKEAIEAAAGAANPKGAYRRVEEQAETFFMNFRRRHRDGNPATSYDPWVSENTIVTKLTEANWHVCSHFCKSKIHFERVTIIATILANGEPDRFQLTCRFSVPEEPLIAMKLSVMNTVNHDYLGRTNWKIYDIKNDTVIPAIVVPIRNPDAPQNRFIAIYFESPLAANSGPYQLDISDYTDVILDEIQKKRKDKLQFLTDRAEGVTEQMEFVIVHDKEKRLSVAPRDDVKHLSSPLSQFEKDSFRGPLAEDRYEVTGLKMRKVPQAKAGMLISLQ